MIETKTKSGTTVILEIQEDNGLLHVYGNFTHPKIGVQKVKIYGWETAAKRGNIEGAKATGPKGPVLLTIPRKDYDKIQAERRSAQKTLDRKNLKLVPINFQGNLCWFSGYTLSTRVSPTDWDKIKHLCKFVNSGINDDTWGGEKYKGWVVIPGQEDQVEELLQVALENRLAYRKAQKERAKAHKLNCQEKVKEVVAYIQKHGVKPAGWNSPSGQVIPIGKGEDIYGGGKWFIVNDNEIWLIQNNGHDGDDWSLNNVRTGGAGAIGMRVPYDNELAEKIRLYGPQGGLH